ncbi:MAG: hypothetical protein KF802_04980 [Bdellovibrionaceae bacterium]|nr:hypothetical protein [Pseudobdellovibrionaceae bacterium]
MQPNVNSAKDAARDVRDGAKDIARDVRDGAKDLSRDVRDGAQKAAGAVSDKFQDLKGSAERTLTNADIQSIVENIRQSAQATVESTEDTIKRHPLTAVLGAAAVGAVVGTLIGRMRH